MKIGLLTSFDMFCLFYICCFYVNKPNNVVKLGSRLCGLTPKVFWLIPLFVSEIRLFCKRHLNIFRGFYRVPSLKKRITKPKFLLQQHLALHFDNLPESAFYNFFLMCPLSLQWDFGNLCSPSGRCAMTVTMQGYLRRILGTR